MFELSYIEILFLSISAYATGAFAQWTIMRKK